MRTLLHYALLACALLGERATSAGQAQTSTADTVAQFDKLVSIPAYVLRTYYYAADSGRTRVHVRLALVNDVLQFTQTEAGRFRAAYEVNLIVLNQDRNMVASRIAQRELEVADFAQTNDRQQPNEQQADFVLMPGNYELQVEICDLHTQRRLRRSYPLTLPNFAAAVLQLSSLAFGTRASQHDTLQYNLLAILSDTAAQQGVFYEISGVQPHDTLALRYVITDWKKAELAQWQTTCVAAHALAQIFEPLVAEHLRHQGLQTLHITASTRAQTVEAEIDYRVQFAASSGRAYEALLKEYPGLAYLPLRYITSDKEFKRLLDTPQPQRDHLLASFWRERDPTPGTAANELREEFYRRVAYAQMRFALHGIEKAGWETDRGRIYIVYGPPQEVHQQMSARDSSPYEVWLYPKAERRFVFMDKKGSGEYELVNR